MNISTSCSLQEHLKSLQSGQRSFENAFQSVSRMILENPIQKVSVNGKSTYDFGIFRQDAKHIIGMYDEINSFVSYVKDAAENGSSREMAFVLIGEPGNGKTFFVDFLCQKYRQFLQADKNRKFSFRFNGLALLESYGKIRSVESQTYEDPAILAMNLFESEGENKEFLEKSGFKDAEIEELYTNYRPLGACSSYILQQFKDHFNDDIDKILKNISILCTSARY